MNKMTRDEMIDLYCQDWKKTDRPWERWQCRHNSKEAWEEEPKWFDLTIPPVFCLEKNQYRRKPARIKGWFAKHPTAMFGPYETKESARDHCPTGECYIYIDTEVAE